MCYLIANESDLESVNEIRKSNKLIEIGISDLCQSRKLVTYLKKVEGFVSGYITLKSDNSLETDTAGKFEVFVHADKQGNKVGTKLIEFIENYVEKTTAFEKLELGVSTDNADAQRLYERMGYVVVHANSRYKEMSKEVSR